MKRIAFPLFMLSFLLCFGVVAAENLLKNSKFNQTVAGKPNQIANWSHTGGISLRQASGKLELVTSATAPEMRVEQFLKPAPGWGTLRLSGKIEISRIKPVKNANFGVYFAVISFNADKKIIQTMELDVDAGKNVGHHDVSRIFSLPAGTTQIAIQFRVRSADVTARIVEPVLEVLGSPGEAVDAIPPPGRTIDWGKEPIVTRGSDRAEIVLNGLWQLQMLNPDINKDMPAPKGWGLAHVPGTWNSNRRVESIAAHGGGALWTGNPNDAAAAWFRRTLEIPADWQGRTIELELERVGTVAEVWIDGVFCGKTQHPGGFVDLTPAAKPGKKSELLIKVLAVSDVKEMLEIEGAAADQFYTRKISLEGKGLTGDVVLHSRPAGGGYSGVFIQPSVRKQTLKLILEFSGLDKAGSWKIAARAIDKNGKSAKEFPARTVILKPGESGDATATVEYPWSNPELWDIDQPNLYDLELTVTGNGRTETILERFGFREFHIAGREFFLNNRKFNLRPMVLSGWSSPTFTIEGMAGIIEGWKKAGFNLHEVWPQEDFPGKIVYPERACLDYAAAIGWPVIADLPSVRPLRLTFTEDQKAAAAWQALTEAKLKKYRNNPAIVMWVHSANSYNSYSDQNPRYIGQPKRFLEENNGLTNLPSGHAVSEILSKLDPTRPNFSHAGQIGDVFSVNNYLSMIPLQEQEEWLSDYVQHGTQPFLAVEFGFIAGFDFRRGRSGYRFTNKTEKQMTEHLAAFYGREAYEKESWRTATDNRDTHVKDQEYRSTDAIIPDELALDLFARMNRQVFRSWRTTGSTGGMIPWMIKDGYDLGRLNKPLLLKSMATVKTPPFQPGRRGFYRSYLTREERYGIGPEAATPNVAGKALSEVNSATLAWLGGASIPGDVVDFTEKSHHFYGGETVTKQVVIHNDLRQKTNYRYELKLFVDGRELDALKGSGSIDDAGKRLFPVEFKLPKVGQKTNAELRLVAQIGDDTHSDTFRLRIFPPRPQPAQNTIAIWDPKGETSRFLKAANYRIGKVDNLATTRGLALIGRDNLEWNQKLPSDLEQFVLNGGTLLIMAHKSYGGDFRYGHFVQRQIFPINANSPITAGLDQEDLRDWRGTGTLISSHPPTSVPQAKWGWHWGNRGSVASRNIEKPHHGGWTPLLESDFDLQYTPLMELARGKGGIIVCQLDFEDNLADPAAMRLLDNLIAYAKAKKFTPRSSSTVYLGGAKGQDRLKSFGLEFKSADTVPADATLVLVGDGANITRSELETAVRRGAKVAVIDAKAAKTVLRLNLAKRSNYRGSLTPPPWPEAAGLSASDLRWRSPLDAELLAETPGLEIGANGQLGRLTVPGGDIAVSLLDPDRFDTDKLPYWRLTRWRQTRALNQLIANLGGEFSTDKEFLNTATNASNRIGFAKGWKGKFLVRMGRAPAPLKDPGMSAAATAAVRPGFDDSRWPSIDLPFVWQKQAQNDPKWGEENGEAVFRREIDIPPEMAGKELILNLGVIDDRDKTFFNGELVGETDNYQAVRNYTVPGRLVKTGRNVIAIRVFDNFGDGGFFSDEDTFRLLKNQPAPGLYHSDYIDAAIHFKNADHPHRYYRW